MKFLDTYTSLYNTFSSLHPPGEENDSPEQTKAPVANIPRTSQFKFLQHRPTLSCSPQRQAPSVNVLPCRPPSQQYLSPSPQIMATRMMSFDTSIVLKQNRPVNNFALNVSKSTVQKEEDENEEEEHIPVDNSLAESRNSSVRFKLDRKSVV